MIELFNLILLIGLFIVKICFYIWLMLCGLCLLSLPILVLDWLILRSRLRRIR